MGFEGVIQVPSIQPYAKSLEADFGKLVSEIPQLKILSVVYPPNFSPMTLTSARNTCSSHLTSAAAWFPTHRHGSPKSLSWTMLSPAGRMVSADEFKHETPCTRRRRFAEARLSLVFPY